MVPVAEDRVEQLDVKARVGAFLSWPSFYDKLSSIPFFLSAILLQPNLVFYPRTQTELSKGAGKNRKRLKEHPRYQIGDDRGSPYPDQPW